MSGRITFGGELKPSGNNWTSALSASNVGISNTTIARSKHSSYSAVYSVSSRVHYTAVLLIPHKTNNYYYCCYCYCFYFYYHNCCYCYYSPLG